MTYSWYFAGNANTIYKIHMTAKKRAQARKIP
jgi:hypothetical protein